MKVYQGLMWPAGRMLDTPALAAESRLNEHKQLRLVSHYFLWKKKENKPTHDLQSVHLILCHSVTVGMKELSGPPQPPAGGGGAVHHGDN